MSLALLDKGVCPQQDPPLLKCPQDFFGGIIEAGGVVRPKQVPQRGVGEEWPANLKGGQASINKVKQRLHPRDQR